MTLSAMPSFLAGCLHLLIQRDDTLYIASLQRGNGVEQGVLNLRCPCKFA